jgi:hypothetical protein
VHGGGTKCGGRSAFIRAQRKAHSERKPKSGKSKMLSFGIYKLNVEGLTYELVEYIELKIFLI